MHRFFLPGDFDAERVELPPDISRQIASVLRLRPGEQIAVFNGSGEELRVRLERVSTGTAEGVIIGRSNPGVEPRLAITICQAVLKADRFEFVLQRCTELGVARFQPVITERCVASMPGGGRLTRWERIVREAAEQSGRVAVPPIARAITLPELAASDSHRPAILLWEAESAHTLREALEERLKGAPARLSLIIGPEGGIDPREADILRKAGVAVAGMGKRILRAETAAVAATVAALYHSGALG